MTLFKIKNIKAERVLSIMFRDEKKEIQEIIGNNSNMVEFFGLDFIKNEFRVKGRFIDTLAYDRDNKSFAIFEYKKDRNKSVIDQGFTYLSLMLENRSQFVLEYNNKNKLHLTESDFDWSQSRVIFLSPKFTDYQIGATNFKDLPFKLYKIRKYDNGEILIDEIKPTSSAPSFNSLKTKGIVQKVGKEVEVYTLDYHLGKINSEMVIKRVKDFREEVLKIDESIKEHYTKDCVVFRTNVAFCNIFCQSKQFWIDVKLNKEDVKLETVGLDVRPHKDKVWTHIRINDGTDLNLLLSLVKRAYESTV